MNNPIWRKFLSQFSLPLASQAARAWALGAKKKACLSETPVQNAINGLSYKLQHNKRINIQKFQAVLRAIKG
jgi:hypothetical protein